VFSTSFCPATWPLHSLLPSPFAPPVGRVLQPSLRHSPLRSSHALSPSLSSLPSISSPAPSPGIPPLLTVSWSWIGLHCNLQYASKRRRILGSCKCRNMGVQYCRTCMHLPLMLCCPLGGRCGGSVCQHSHQVSAHPAGTPLFAFCEQLLHFNHLPTPGNGQARRTRQPDARRPWQGSLRP